MPNICYNSLKISGVEQSITEFKTKNLVYRDDESPSDPELVFDNLVPIIPGSNITERYRLWGTKWSSVKCKMNQDDSMVCRLIFESAWDPPIPWLLQIKPLFPKLAFQLEFEESGCNFAGIVDIDIQGVVRRQIITYTENVIHRTFGKTFIHDQTLILLNIKNNCSEDEKSLEIMRTRLRQIIEDTLDEDEAYLIKQLVFDATALIWVKLNKMKDSLPLIINYIKQCRTKRLQCQLLLNEELEKFSLTPPMTEYPLLMNGGSMYREIVSKYLSTGDCKSIQ